MIARERLRWNGWGRLGEGAALTAARERALLALLAERFEREIRPAEPPVAAEDVRLPAPRLARALLARLRAICGEDGVRTGSFERLTHAAGKSLPDLLRLRRGELSEAPDAVVFPKDEGAVASLLRLASEAGLAVVPFGGGTSVVGGVAPQLRDGQQGVLALDTTRLDALVRVDAESQTATFQAGIEGPALEAALRAHGLTLGHYPQSFEHSTLGGWIATRSTGQYSNVYGGIEDRLAAVRVVTPEGVLRTLAVPRSATGPDANALALGSEGTLGVIVEATLRVAQAPAAEAARGYLFRDFEGGALAVRDAVRAGAGAAMLRLADATETALSAALRRDPTRRVDLSALALGAAERLGYGDGRCALIAAAEGSRGEVAARLRALGRRMRRAGALPLGAGPGAAWLRERFRTPHLRDWLLDHDVAVDTLETALPWSRVTGAHDEVVRGIHAALERHAGAGIAMAHLSHAYSDGACLYFSFLYPIEPLHAVKQWEDIQRDAIDALLRAGGTLSHHHGVGLAHRPWLPAEKGSVALAALRAAKHALDPAGVMNPGKLL